MRLATQHLTGQHALTLILDAAADVEDDAVAEGVAIAVAAILSADEIDARVVVSHVRSAAIAVREAEREAKRMAEVAAFVAQCAEGARAAEALLVVLADLAGSDEQWAEYYDEVQATLMALEIHGDL